MQHGKDYTSAACNLRERMIWLVFLEASVAGHLKKMSYEFKRVKAVFYFGSSVDQDRT